MSLKNSFAWILIGALVGASAVFTAGEAIAQTSSDIDPLEGLGTDDDGDALFGDGANPFDIIHRAVLSPSMSAGEYQQQQQRAITNEAEAFRLRQQEALRQQPSLEADEMGEEAAESDLL